MTGHAGNLEEFLRRRWTLRTAFPKREVQRFQEERIIPKECEGLSPIAFALRYADWRYLSMLEEWNEDTGGNLPTAEEMRARTLCHMEEMFLGGFHPEEILGELRRSSPYAFLLKAEELKCLFSCMLLRLFHKENAEVEWHPSLKCFAVGTRNVNGDISASSGMFDLSSLEYQPIHGKIIAGGVGTLRTYLMATAHFYHWEEYEQAQKERNKRFRELDALLHGKNIRGEMTLYAQCFSSLASLKKFPGTPPLLRHHDYQAASLSGKNIDTGKLDVDIFQSMEEKGIPWETALAAIEAESPYRVTRDELDALRLEIRERKQKCQ